MKATELRIGSYAKDPYDREIKLVSVEKDASMLRPIPLTEEWLLKFGFNKFQNRKIWIRKRVRVYLHSKDGFCYGLSSSRTKIKYVHQLQNLYFALTGNELEIKEK